MGPVLTDPVTALSVDNWSVTYDQEDNLVEKYCGKQEMKKVSSMLYLGFTLAEDGSNVPNITAIRNKTIGKETYVSLIYTVFPNLNLLA